MRMGSFLQEVVGDVDQVVELVASDVVHTPTIAGNEVASLIDALCQHLELLVAHILMHGQSQHLLPQKQPPLAFLAVVDPVPHISEWNVQ